MTAPATTLLDAFTAIQRDHQQNGGLPYCTGCDRLITDQAAHVADLQIAYLRDNLAQHGEELGMRRQPFPTIDRNLASPEWEYLYANTFRFVTDWSRADD